MLIRTRGFNLYLSAFLSLVLLFGCQSPEKKAQKKPAFLRVHIEAPAKIPNRTKEVTVFRRAPMVLNVEPLPFVSEDYVKNATVIDSMGGFAMKIEFVVEGRHLLEQYTSGNPSRRLVIFTHFVDPKDPKIEIDRWLAAPRISQAITNGMLVFTPDASKEEAEAIARGLRNSAKKTGSAKEE